MNFYIPPGSQPSEPPQARAASQEPIAPIAECDDHGDIPDDLAMVPRWLLMERDGALVCGVTGYLVEDANGPHHWASLDHANAIKDGTNAVVFALGEHGEEAFIGLLLRNGCLADGECAEWALHLLVIADSYTESIEGGGLQCVIRVPADDYRTLLATFGERHVQPFEDGLAELHVGGVLRLGGVHRPPFPGVAPLRAGICALLAALLAVPRPEERKPGPDLAREPLSVELTVLAKDDGPLTKRISLSANGAVVADGTACIMSHGAARRARLTNLAELSALIERMASHEALALGVLREDLPDQVTIVTKAKLNGGAGPNVIARTHHNIAYRAGQSALALIDFDSKGMPRWVKARLAEAGSVWAALVGIVPELGSVGRVIRPSTSSGLHRTGTGEQLPGSQNQHIYVLVKDGAGIERFLRDLHARCWLAGYGWFIVGAAGQLLERSIIDRMVGAPERLVFEGPPVLVPPVAQDAAARAPTVIEGSVLDTITACRPLTVVEQSRLHHLRDRARLQLKEAAATARAAFIAEHAAVLAARTGKPIEQSRRVIGHQCNGVLLPDIVLPFDDPALADCTVADVLADPERFDGATLADPLEGVAYGTCKARIMRRDDGTPWIHSFAHGRTVYELKLDMAAAKAAIDAARKEDAAATFVRVVLAGTLDDAEIQQLCAHAAARAEIGIRALSRMLNEARSAQQERRALEERQRRAAARSDPRPQLLVPHRNAEFLPQMTDLNEVLGAAKDAEPPMREIDGTMVAVRERHIPGMHLLTSAGANAEEPEDSRLPPPEQPLLTRLTEEQLAELIERHVEYVTANGTPVHLPPSFVRHYHVRTDNVLPTAVAVATLPMVLSDGAILSGRSLNRERGIVFRVPRELEALLPRREQCTRDSVKAAMRFLMDDWLCDVMTDDVGKCVLIAAALTLIERSLLPERPMFFVTAGRRGGGKTTTLIMLLVAVTGVRPAAAAWSPDAEERRKALLTYMLDGAPAIIWDNIPRGAQISCPHIERACTTAFYSDRRLGVNELIVTSAATVNFATGNNIGAVGDLASRRLEIRLNVDRPDPENREFRHPDPIDWTFANRGPILQALYTIMLAAPRNSAAKTRFKSWWRLAGAPVEHAAHCCDLDIDFQTLFLSQEANDDETATLADALTALAEKWANEANFPASAVADLINNRNAVRIGQEDQECGEILHELLFPECPPDKLVSVSAKAVGKRLTVHIDEPVQCDDHQVLVLRSVQDPSAGARGRLLYAVKRQQPSIAP